VRENYRGSIQYNPFSSKRKKMSVLVPEGEGGGKQRVLYVKGAGRREEGGR
jgi:magnesium-transporting ATPase (P-type)